MNIVSLFGGIEGGKISCERAGIEIDNYYSSEVDKYAIQIAHKNNPDIIQLGDINNWRNWNIDWKSIDLLLGGSPCQGFSIAGKQLNFNDERSKLFFIYADILNHIKNLNPNIKFILENVKMKKEFSDVITGTLGVEPIEIDSCLVSAQNRKRLYWSNIKGINQPNDKHILFKSILENGSTDREKSQTILATIYKENAKSMIKRKKYGLLVKQNDGTYRKLTPLECERLQTLPDNYTQGISNTQRYKCLGNAWTVDVITHILTQLTERKEEWKL